MKQRSVEWYRARLGHITSSMVYVLMPTPRKKDEVFTETAKSYLYQLAAERLLKEEYKADMSEWFKRNEIMTRDMRWGINHEDEARAEYARILGGNIAEEGFVEYNEYYGDSPDGLVVDESGEVVGCLEVKCPSSSTFMKYRYLLASGKSLKEVEEKYYWQCLSHIICNNTDYCDFFAYDPMLECSTACTRVTRDGADIQMLMSRIDEAIEFIKNIMAEEVVLEKVVKDAVELVRKGNRIL